MKITLVTAYYNRKELFERTLQTIARSSYNNFEFIAVDDASDEEERIEDLEERFDFLQVIRVEPRDKWWKNPCIPYNMGFSVASGDVIIIQNPECLHVGDIVSCVAKNLGTPKGEIEKNKYLVFNCYSIDQMRTEMLKVATDEELEVLIQPYLPSFNGDGRMGWYNHHEHRPTMYHFCSAITREDLHDLSGFDERFAHGIGFDDNEFLERLTRGGKTITPVLSEEVIAVHQYHAPSNYQIGQEYINKNRELYDTIRLEKHIKASENEVFNV